MTASILLTVAIQLYRINSFKYDSLNDPKNLDKMDFYFSDLIKVSTNDSIKYLGKTEAFYFLWNRKSKVSTIYQAVDVKKVLINP